MTTPPPTTPADDPAPAATRPIAAVIPDAAVEAAMDVLWTYTSFSPTGGESSDTLGRSKVREALNAALPHLIPAPMSGPLLVVTDDAVEAACRRVFGTTSWDMPSVSDRPFKRDQMREALEIGVALATAPQPATPSPPAETDNDLDRFAAWCAAEHDGDMLFALVGLIADFRASRDFRARWAPEGNGR